MTSQQLDTSKELEDRQRGSQVLVCPIITDTTGRDDIVVLIKKKSPDWQIGMLNLPGGKADFRVESPWNAALRELREDTGLEIENIIHVGTMRPSESLKIWCYAGRIDIHTALAAQNVETDEEVICLKIRDALQHPKLLNNLRYLIPLSLVKLDNFTEAR